MWNTQNYRPNHLKIKRCMVYWHRD